MEKVLKYTYNAEFDSVFIVVSIVVLNFLFYFPVLKI